MPRMTVRSVGNTEGKLRCHAPLVGLYRSLRYSMRVAIRPGLLLKRGLRGELTIASYLLTTSGADRFKMNKDTLRPYTKVPAYTSAINNIKLSNDQQFDYPTDRYRLNVRTGPGLKLLPVRDENLVSKNQMDDTYRKRAGHCCLLRLVLRHRRLRSALPKRLDRRPE